MHRIEFAPIGRETSRIGLGCGRLVGRSSFRQSARLVEQALELGIRYFDVAPSYGLGTADEVLGAVIGNSKEVVIATKVGVPRPIYSARANLLRGLIRPVLNRIRPLKDLVLRARSSARSAERPRYDFSVEGIRASLEESLRNLRRDSVDVFLAHEPHPEDLTDEVASRFEDLRREGLIRAFGVGIGAVGDRWSRFGSIWQSAWPGPAARSYARDVEHIWHGAIRAWSTGPGGQRPSPWTAARAVLDQSPTSILLISASTTRHLQELAGEVDS
jgi:aryl-alcohol dehydrogenase-like predicted oxidoreductase